MSFPSYGDETFAFRLSTDPTIIGSLEADCIFIRHGRVLVVVVYAGIGFSGIDSDQTDKFVRQAEDKVKPILAPPLVRR